MATQLEPMRIWDKKKAFQGYFIRLDCENLDCGWASCFCSCLLSSLESSESSPAISPKPRMDAIAVCIEDAIMKQKKNPF